MTTERPNRLETLEPGVRRVLAPNASPMTYWGTNTYIIGEGRVAVIDPGPAIEPHMHAILDALSPGETISHIFVTHSHIDHSPLAAPLARRTGAPVIAYGDSFSGRSDVMNDLAAADLAGGGEGVDLDFSPDETLADGETLSGDSWHLNAIWTPGHFGNHLSFAWDDRVFTGDHIMGWASSLVSPPDGDLTAFMTSTEKLASRRDRVFYPGHGAAITNPVARARWLINHRQTRSAAIITTLQDGSSDVKSLTAKIYVDVSPNLIGMAERNVFAHLIDLVHHSHVQAEPELAFNAHFSLI